MADSKITVRIQALLKYSKSKWALKVSPSIWTWTKEPSLCQPTLAQNLDRREKSLFRSAKTSFTTRSSVSGSFFFFSLSFSFSSVSFFGHPRHPRYTLFHHRYTLLHPCYTPAGVPHANICVFVLLSFSVPPQGYGLHGPQIGSICQTHVVIFPISTLQTFLEQFVLVIVVSCRWRIPKWEIWNRQQGNLFGTLVLTSVELLPFQRKSACKATRMGNTRVSCKFCAASE